MEHPWEPPPPPPQDEKEDAGRGGGMWLVCLEAAKEIQSLSLNLQWVSGCLSLESEPNHFPWAN